MVNECAEINVILRLRYTRNYSPFFMSAHFCALFCEKFRENARCTTQVHLRFSLNFLQKIASKLGGRGTR